MLDDNGEKDLDQNIFIQKLQIDFVHRRGGVKEFCDTMTRLKDDKFLGLNVASILVNTIWDQVYPRIVTRVFVPYLVYFFSFIAYISFFFDPETPTH